MMRILGTLLPLLKISYHNYHPSLWRLQPFSHTHYKVWKDGKNLKTPKLISNLSAPTQISHVQFYSQGPSKVLQEECNNNSINALNTGEKFVLPVGVFAPKGEVNDGKLLFVPLDIAHMDGARLKKMMKWVNKIQLRGKQIEAFAAKEITEDQNMFLKFEFVNEATTLPRCLPSLSPILEAKSCPLPLEQSNDIIEIDDKCKSHAQEIIIGVPLPLEDRMNELAIGSMQLSFDLDTASMNETIAHRSSEVKSDDESRISIQTKVDLNRNYSPEEMTPLNFIAQLKGNIHMDAKKLPKDLSSFNQNLSSIATSICSTALEESIFSNSNKTPSDINDLHLNEFSLKLKDNEHFVTPISQQQLPIRDEFKPTFFATTKTYQELVPKKGKIMGEDKKLKPYAMKTKKDPGAKKYSTFVGRSHWTPNSNHQSIKSKSQPHFPTYSTSHLKRNYSQCCTRFSPFVPRFPIFTSSFYRDAKGRDKNCRKKKPDYSSKKCACLKRKAGFVEKKKEKSMVIPGLRTDCFEEEEDKPCIPKYCATYLEVKEAVQELYKCKPCYKPKDDCKYPEDPCAKKKPKECKKEKKEKKKGPSCKAPKKKSSWKKS